MSKIFDESKRMLVVGEVGVINKYFSKWLRNRRVVVRVSKTVLINELEQFTLAMSTYYDHKNVSASILNEDFIQENIDNMLRDILKEGLRIFNAAVKSTIAEIGTNRITINKLEKLLEEYVVYSQKAMIYDADKGILW